MPFKRPALVSMALCCLLHPSVSAQEPPDPPTSPPDPVPPGPYVESVVVTAEKWEADASKVPLSLSVVTPDILSSSGAFLLHQVGAYVPGLFLRNDGDRSFNKPSLRGITSSPFNDPAVTVYVDDVAVDPRMGLAMPLFDVRQIEVVRGPHGVVWGRNTSGGMMHVVSALPGTTWQRHVALSAGSYGEVVAPFSVQGPVSDRLFLGLSGLYDQRDGFLDNPVNRSEVDRRNGMMARVQLRWLPAPAWDVQVRNDVGVWRDGAFLASPIGAVGSYRVRSDSENREDSQALQQSVRIVREGRRASLLAVVSRRAVDVYRISDEDLADGPVQEYTWSDLDDVRWNAEIRLRSPRSARVRWLLGAYAGTRDATDGYETFLPVTFAGYSERNWASYRDRTLASFGQIQLPVGTRTHVTAGLRLDRDRKRMDRADRLYGFPTPTPEDDFTAPGFTGERTFTFVSPRVSLDVAVGPGVLLFGGIARGARSGGFNFTTDSPALAGFAGEFVLSVEGGLKARRADGRADLAISVYRSAISDLQVQQFIAGFFAVANAGRATARGVEVEGEVTLGKNLRLRGNAARTWATLDDFNNGFVDLSGNDVPSVPSYTALAALDWRGPGGVEATAEVSGTGRVYFDEANVARAPAYGLLNLVAGIARERWAVHVYGRNLTGTRYATTIVPGFFQVPGSPRRFGVSLSVFDRR
jgi:iron complex outermembrane recepter protein